MKHMRTFFKITEHTVFVALIVLSLLNYFFPLLYLQDRDIVEFGIPLSFYKVYLAPLPTAIPAAQVSIFSAVGLLSDILFAFLMACFAVFVEKKFREGNSPAFHWILRTAIFLATILFVIRLFVRGF